MVSDGTTASQQQPVDVAPADAPAGDTAGGDQTEQTDNKKDDSDDDDSVVIENPWNAVCVIGLRVYSKHPSIQVDVKNSRDAEANLLELGKAISAGATS